MKATPSVVQGSTSTSAVGNANGRRLVARELLLSKLPNRSKPWPNRATALEVSRRASSPNASPALNPGRRGTFADRVAARNGRGEADELGDAQRARTPTGVEIAPTPPSLGSGRRTPLWPRQGRPWAPALPNPGTSSRGEHQQPPTAAAHTQPGEHAAQLSGKVHGHPWFARSDNSSPTTAARYGVAGHSTAHSNEKSGTSARRLSHTPPPKPLNFLDSPRRYISARCRKRRGSVRSSSTMSFS
jgi:hypothetical protein